MKDFYNKSSFFNNGTDTRTIVMILQHFVLHNSLSHVWNLIYELSSISFRERQPNSININTVPDNDTNYLHVQEYHMG